MENTPTQPITDSVTKKHTAQSELSGAGLGIGGTLFITGLINHLRTNTDKRADTVLMVAGIIIFSASYIYLDSISNN